jgi:hypothetical protein
MQDIDRVLADIEPEPSYPPLSYCYHDVDEWRWFVLSARGTKSPPNCNSTLDSVCLFFVSISVLFYLFCFHVKLQLSFFAWVWLLIVIWI